MKSKLNGSVDTLAKAMREVFSEAVETAILPVRKDMEGMEARLNKNMSNMEDRINKRMDTTNENMQSQFAQQQKEIGIIKSTVSKLGATR